MMIASYSDLKNKNILIVGATSGIGLQCATDLNQQGSNLYLVGRSKEKIETLKENLSSHKCFQMDITDTEKIIQLIDQLPDLDGVVFSIGTNKPILTKYIKEEDILNQFNVNLFSIINVVAALQKKKKLKKASSLVFLSSAVTKYPFVGGALYTSSKLALEGYVKVLALELSSKKIRANCIAPNFVRTPFLGENEKYLLEEAVEKHKNIHLLGMGEAEDVAQNVLYLLSDASKWVSGSTIYLGGGV